MRRKGLVFLIITVILFSSSGISQVHLNSGLIAYYPFNGNANDATGNGNNGTPMNGVQLTTDRFGNPNSAYLFDGIDDYIIVNDNGKLSPASVTVAAYVNTQSIIGQSIAGKIDYNTGNAGTYLLGIDYGVQTGFFLGADPGGGSCFVQYPYNPNNPFAKSTGAFSTDVWHCVVGTFDNSVLKIYVDGVLADTKSSPTPQLLQCSNTQLLIGAWWTGDLIPFNGKIDEVRIYNRALNQDEINALCGLQSCAPLQGTLSGSSICSGNTQGLLTFHSPASTGPFTLTYTDGTNTYTQTNVLDSVPFAVQSQPLTTTTYTLLAIEDTTNCPPTPLTGVTATITVGNCSLCTGSLGDPVVNVTFGSGTNPGQPISSIVPGASTTLQYVAVSGNPAAPTPMDGQYTITNNVPVNPDWFSGATDHTPNDPNGYMAFYNSSVQPGEFYEQTISSLCGSTTYQFAAWIANALNPAATSGVDPDISFLIEQTDGTVLAAYDTGPIGQSSVFTWLQYGFDFTTPANTTTVVLKMVNNSPGGITNLGNDLAIDDITFRACGPASTASFSATRSSDSLAACEGTDTVVYGNLSSGYSSPAYLWQVSKDSGATWVDIPNSNTLQLAIAPPATGSTTIYEYRLLGAEGANINSPNCRVVSNPAYFISLHPPVPDFSFDEAICNPLQVQFSGVALPNGQYNWLIDGTAYTGIQSPSHNFSQFGTYHVKLTVVYPGGCSNSILENIPIQVAPAAIIITHDTTICSGKSLSLNTLPALDFCWSPTDYLDNPALANPVATPPVTTKYYFTAKISGANLITNGDFSGGNTGFASDYAYSSSGIPESVYFLGTNPNTWNPGMSPCTDHTTGSGDMMLVNGSQQLGTRVWTETVNVQPNTTYAFSAWLQSISNISPAILQFSINGVPLGNPLQAGATTCVWASFYTTWNSGSQATAVISIVNQNQAASGNDFALDDLSFAPIGVEMDSVTVSVETPSVAAFPDTIICRGMPVPLRAGGGVATYSWSPGATLSDSTLADPVATPAATTSYIVTGTSSDGCTAKDTILVALFPNTTVILTPDTTLCLGDPAPLQASGGVTYSWSPPQYLDNPGIANPVATPVKTTRFFLTATDANHCSETDSVTLSIRPIPVFQAPPDSVILCAGNPVKLGSGDPGPYIYAWSPGNSLNDPASPNPIATPATTTAYTLQISDSVCVHYDSTFGVSVHVKPNPVVVAKKANDIDCSVATSQLNAAGAASYAWSPAEGLSNPNIPDPLVSIDSTTTFIVRGEDGNGCFAFDTVTVNVTATGKNLFVVPNAFSPNRDGHNDCFGIQRWGDVTIEEFSVFNRWGVCVFTTRNPSECWDGNFRGKPQETGVYPYVIKARSFCGEITRTGLVMLVR